MPVYEQGYQVWSGKRRSPLFRWMAIPKFTWLEFFKVKSFTTLTVAAWVQFFIRLGYIYLLVNTEFLKAMKVPTAGLPQINAFFFKNTIDVQLPFCFLFCFLLGAGLISKDLRHSALVLYFSKPISRWEYFLGKFCSLFLILFALSGVQGALLFAIQTVVAPEQSSWHLRFWQEYAWILKAIVLYSLVVSATISLLILAASSSTKNSRYAGTSFAAYILGAAIAGSAFREVFSGNEYLYALSPYHVMISVGYHVFQMESPRALSAPVAWSGVFLLCGLSTAVIAWRLKSAARYGR